MPTPFKWLPDVSSFFGRQASLVARADGSFELQASYDLPGPPAHTNTITFRYSAAGGSISGPVLEAGAAINSADPSGALLTDGRRVYVWTEAPQAGGGDGRDVMAQIRYADGTGAGSVDVGTFLVTGGAGDQTDPAVAANLSTGGFAVAVNDRSVGSGQLILKFYSATGDLLTTVTPGNPTANVYGSEGRNVAITGLANGNYVVTWTRPAYDVRAQIYSSNGVAVGSEFIMPGGGQEAIPAITTLADGRFVVVYLDTGIAGVSAQIHNADGTVAVPAFTVGTDFGASPFGISVAALNDGRFVVVWEDSSNGGDIKGQVMFANGTADGASFTVNTLTTGAQTDPTVVTLADGRFVVSWTDASSGQDALKFTIFDPRETNINMSGSTFSDDAYGTSFNDAYYAGAGNDTVRGQGGSDYILGEGGNDSLLGGDATDLLYGGAGFDSLQGEAGDDFVYGGVGDDTVSGAGGNDVLYGEAGNDFIAGDDGNDTVIGGDGNDSMYGYANDDAMDGGADNDTAYGGLGNDFIRGGAGNDVLIGEDGNDQLYGEDGADSLDGGIGADTFYGGAGNDTAVGGAGGDVLIGEAGQDDLRGGDDDDSIDGGADGDTLRGENGNDFIQGQDGDDFIDGGANVDDLRGGNGNDTIIGGSGGDTMYGNAGNDVFRFAVGSGSDAIVGWEDGLDRIDISTYAGATFANTVITQVGGDTRVTFVSGDSVLLIGVSAATVTIADFIT